MFFVFEHHGCMEAVMQGLRAHSDSFLAAMWLECYVLLHYFERGIGPTVGVWDQVTVVQAERSATVRRFGPDFRTETTS